MSREHSKLQRSSSPAQSRVTKIFKMYITLATELECSTKGDKLPRSFNSIICLPGDRIAFFDVINSELILYNSEYVSFSSLHLKKPCWALAYVDNDTFVATVGSKVRFYAAKPGKLKQQSRKFVCEGPTKGISFNNSRYAVIYSVGLKNNIVILDRKGRAITHIKAIESHGHLMDISDKVVLDKTGEFLYMCEGTNDRLACLSIQGKVLWIRDHATTSVCNHILCLRDFLLVLDGNNTVTLIRLTGNVVHSEKLPPDGTTGFPLCIGYDELVKKLYVVKENDATIRAFNMLYYDQ